MSSAPVRPSRRRLWPWVLVLFMVVLPIAEIALIIAIGQAIGGWQTFLLILLWSMVGAWLVRREWSTAWRGLREALRSGAMPARELADAALVLVGGTLLLLPGFITDVLGLLFILPFTRPVARRLLQALVARRLMGGFGGGRVVRGERVMPTYDAQSDRKGPKGPGAPMAPGEPGAIEGKIVRD